MAIESSREASLILGSDSSMNLLNKRLFADSAILVDIRATIDLEALSLAKETLERNLIALGRQLPPFQAGHDVTIEWWAVVLAPVNKSSAYRFDSDIIKAK